MASREELKERVEELRRKLKIAEKDLKDAERDLADNDRKVKIELLECSACEKLKRKDIDLFFCESCEKHFCCSELSVCPDCDQNCCMRCWVVEKCKICTREDYLDRH